MKKEKKHILCLQFKNRSTFALDGRINGVKDMVNADVHTAASRRTDIMDGMNDSPIAGFVKSCLPPPPRFNRRLQSVSYQIRMQTARAASQHAGTLLCAHPNAHRVATHSYLGLLPTDGDQKHLSGRSP